MKVAADSGTQRRAIRKFENKKKTSNNTYNYIISLLNWKGKVFVKHSGRIMSEYPMLESYLNGNQESAFIYWKMKNCFQE